jgi:DNA-directed RNA polymerase specialized sigma24 family protein
MADLEGFDGFVAARSRALLQAAWLLTGDWQLAEDLLQTALARESVLASLVGLSE